MIRVLPGSIRNRLRRAEAAIFGSSNSGEYVVYSLPGETAEEAVARALRDGNKLGRWVAVMPPPLSADEWQRIYSNNEADEGPIGGCGAVVTGRPT